MGGGSIGCTEVILLIRNGCRDGCVKTVRTAEVMIWIMSVASELLGHLRILGDKEARGRVGRPSRGCGRMYRRQLRGRCTRRIDCSEASRGWWPHCASCTDGPTEV